MYGCRRITTLFWTVLFFDFNSLRTFVWGFTIFGVGKKASTLIQLGDSQGYAYYEDGDLDLDGYWSTKRDPEKDRRGGMYKVYFDGDVDPKETQLDWEVCSDGESEALVLLPPAAVERPTAVVHFIGGTFFGSAPKLWYRTL